jgi:hypothetical protein
MTESEPRGWVLTRREGSRPGWARLRSWLLDCRASILVSAIAGGGAGVIWGLQWRGTDVATWVYRVDLFRSYGWMVWDSQWYGGHYLLPYSVLFPPLGAAVGLYTAAALSAAAAAWAFERLLRSHFGSGNTLAGVLFASGTWVAVAIGQFAFLSGEAIALLALLAAKRDRRLLAVTFAVVSSLFSPAAGAFLILAALVWLIADPRDRRGLKIAVAGMEALPLAILGITFPETGSFPFWGSEFLTILIICTLGLALVPTSQRVLRVGLVLYAVMAVPLFFIANPLGGMFGRVAEAFAPAVVLALGTAYRRRFLALLAVPLLAWQATPALAAVHPSSSDPSSQAAYYQSLLTRVSRGPAVGRLEIPSTVNHWEAAYVAPTIPLARGWERQLDIVDNPIFYGTQHLTAASYHKWLKASGVTFVALPDTKLDYSAQTEARLLKAAPSYLSPVWHDSHWRVWKVTDSPGIVSGAATLKLLRPDRFAINATQAGTIIVRVRYTRTWSVSQGHACIQETPDHWTQLVVSAPGRIQVAATLTRQETDSCRQP